ncbi:ATP-binding cassette domain-containing protein [Tropicimonas sp. IMCC34011]|uniref:ATP-binding cassette domain-containing protein n=1 Tax=Tropicimonas sp. IMCC34011 TaxID=2248759 RepID=UPI000E25DA26|nr:ATP-binding cassette domain-containing protein [Tropicimonas sp. IMCC34011]
MTDPILALKGVKRRYRTGGGFFSKETITTAVDDVSLTVAPGEVCAIVGESGSGKSTLARIAAGFDVPDGGEALFRGAPFAKPGSAAWRKERALVQFVFQNPSGALDPRASIASQIGEMLTTHERCDAATRAARIEDILDRVGLAGMGRRVPQQMSGGQLQRAVLARALVVRPELLICDEAVSALDVSVQAQILNLLMSLKDEFGLTMIFITHDLGVARHVGDRIAVMQKGRIVENRRTRYLFDTPRDAYTRTLLAAIPAATPAARRAREASLAPETAA